MWIELGPEPDGSVEREPALTIASSPFMTSGADAPSAPKAGRPTRRRVPVPAVRIRDEGLDCGAAAGVVFEIENEQVGGP